MGGRIRAKQLQQKQQDQALLDSLARKSKALREAAQKGPPRLIEEIWTYRSQFIRDESRFVLKTKSANRSKQLLELVRHVFQRYPVPGFLDQAWEIGNPANHFPGNAFDFRQWYICVASGGSLHKQYLKEVFTKKETHLFLTCPYKLTIPQAIIFALGRALDVRDGAALRVAKTKIVEKPLDDFWKHGVRFFAQEPSCTIDRFNDLIDYLHFKRTENAQFSLAGSGHTLASLTKKMHDWHHDLRRIRAIGNELWDGFPLPDVQYERKDEHGSRICWIFKQIKAARELQQEGNAQRHCVFGYKNGCVRGNLSIWSLTLQDISGIHRKVTIELRSDRSIVQARGLANRIPHANEMHIIRHWANQYQLSVTV